MTATPRFRFGISTILGWTFVCALAAAVTRWLDVPDVGKVVVVFYCLSLATYFALRWPMLRREWQDLRSRRALLDAEYVRLADDVKRRRAERDVPAANETQS